MSTVNPSANPTQIRIDRRSPGYWRVTIDNPPINVMGPTMVLQFQKVINAIEADEDLRVGVIREVVVNCAVGPRRRSSRNGTWASAWLPAAGPWRDCPN